MNTACEYTRSRLSRYQTGHLFKLQQSRIEQHLAECPVCRSEFDALNRIRETERFLVDLEGTGGVPGKVRSLASAGSRLLFRPLWAALIVIAVLAAYRYVVDPILHDPDLEKLDTGSVTLAPAVPQAAVQTAPTPTTSPAVQQARPEQMKEPAPAADSLVVTISVEKEHEKESLKQINDAMKEHALLRTMRFSDKVREVAGNLTADELHTFFNRIQGAAKVLYKRSRLTSLAQGELVPVVIKLQTHAAPARRESEQQQPKPGEKPVQNPVQKPVDIPVENPVGKPLKTIDEQAAAPAQPAR
ncbi:MAG: hypothetical protein OEW15_02165 [Nitrospirota bacterium]|nr:hypothetical protein [Nitrospirota bacterium]